MIQAAGHAGTLKVASKGFILKPLDEAEAKNYEALWEKEGDPLQKYVAKWGGQQDVLVGSEETGETKPFMMLGNLLEQFKKPCVMDCKMGVRTFQEKEAAGKKMREDLYKRLNEISPHMLSAEDHAAGAITKFKWMSSRDAQSTSKKLGFRVDGIVSEQGARIDKKQLDKFTEKDEVLKALPCVLPLRFSHEEGDNIAINKQRVTLIQQIIEQLEGIKEAMQESLFVKTHEFVGASLLFVVDTNLARVHLIDLAKTELVPDGCTLDHRSQWEMGNHEDGMLFGVDNLLECWKTNLSWFEGDKPSMHYFYGHGGGNAMRDLELKLHSYNVDTSTWGKDGAKSMEELYSEINEEKAVTFEIAEDGRFFRVMDVIKAWIMVENNKGGETIVLMEPRKHSKHGEARGKGKPLQKKVTVGEDWRDTVQLGIKQRLGIEPDQQHDVFEFLWKTYKRNEEIRKGTVEDGFSDLWSKYRIHEIDVRIKDSSNPMLRPLGLPEATPFTTMQSGGLHSAFGHRKHAWTWDPISSTSYVARSNEEETIDPSQSVSLNLQSDFTIGTKPQEVEVADAPIGMPRGKQPVEIDEGRADTSGICSMFCWAGSSGQRVSPVDARNVLVLDCGSGSSRGSFYSIKEDGSLNEIPFPHKMDPIHVVIGDGAASTSKFLDQLATSIDGTGAKPISVIFGVTGGLREALRLKKTTIDHVHAFEKALSEHDSFKGGVGVFKMLSGEDEAHFEHKAVNYMAKQVMPDLSQPVGLISSGGTSSQVVYFDASTGLLPSTETKQLSILTNFKQQQLKLLEVGVDEGLKSLDKFLEDLIDRTLPHLVGQLRGIFCCIETVGQIGEHTGIGHKLVSKDAAVEAFTACLAAFREKSIGVDPKAAGWTFKDTFRGCMPILALRLLSLLHPSAQLYFADVWKLSSDRTMQAVVPLGLYLESRGK